MGTFYAEILLALKPAAQEGLPKTVVVDGLRGVSEDAGWEDRG